MARLIAAGLTAAILSAHPAHRADEPRPRAASVDWKAEFDDICAKTQDAMTLTAEELKALLARCDALKPVIEGLDETQRKVYARRLQTCRNLYEFVLEYRQKG